MAVRTEDVVIRITSDTTGLKKTTDELVKQGKVEKDNVKIFEETARKRQFLIDRNIARLKKLELQRKQAFNPKDIRRFDDLIAKTTKDVELLGGRVNKLDKASGGLGRSLGKLGAIVVGAFAVRSIINFGEHLFELAVESEAFEKRARVVFGNSLEIVEEFAEKSAASLGLTTVGFLGAAAAIGDILVPLGLSRQRAAELSVEAVKLGGALKEFTGDSRSAAEISNIVARSLTGEVEGLKTLGVVVDQTSTLFKELVKSKIVDLGLTQQQAKAEAIFQIAIESSADALESFDTNTDSLARQQAIFNAQSDELQETLAELLTPSFITVTTAANKFFGVLKDANKELGFFEKTAIAVASSLGVPVRILTGAFSDQREEIENTNEEIENQIIVVQEQIRNIFFLKNNISALRKEQQAQGTSLQRVAEIQREIIPLQTELNRLLGKDQAGTAIEQLNKRISRLRKELLDQALAGDISTDTIKELNAAVDELTAAEVELQIALTDTLPIMESQALALDKIGDSAQTAQQLVLDFEQIQRDEAQATADARITALDRVSDAQQKAFAIIAQLNTNRLIAIDNEEAAQLKALESRGLGEEQLAAAQLKIQKETDEKRAEILTKQAKADKLAAIIQATINTALAVTAALTIPPPAGQILAALNAVLGAAEIAVIAAQPIPTFHEGKKSELKDGEINAVILKSESVIPPKQSTQHKGIIDSIIDDNLKDYVFKHYQLPILKEMSRESNIFDDRNITGKQSKTNKLLAENNALTKTMIRAFDSGNHRRSWR